MYICGVVLIAQALVIRNQVSWCGYLKIFILLIVFIYVRTSYYLLVVMLLFKLVRNFKVFQ